MRSEENTVDMNFKKRRTIVGIACVVVLAFLIFNTKCANPESIAAAEVTTKMSHTVPSEDTIPDTIEKSGTEEMGKKKVPQRLPANLKKKTSTTCSFSGSIDPKGKWDAPTPS